MRCGRRILRFQQWTVLHLQLLLSVRRWLLQEMLFVQIGRRTTAVHVDCLTDSCIPMPAITTSKTVRHRCFSPAMAGATKTALQRERKPSVLQCREKLSTTKTATSVISRPDRVPSDTTSTVSVSFTDRLSTPWSRATTSADSTPTVDAIITRATVLTGTIRLTVRAIVDLSSIPGRRVAISEDITRTTAQRMRQRKVLSV